jgi:3-(3-hydroxy-phenyl)propionate hydroxylase
VAANSANRVIVVGGGPVGLVSALGLALQDIPVLVLESQPSLFKDLRAGSFHPPSLEVLEPLGVTKKLLETGIVVPRWQFRDRAEGVIGVFELSLLKDETPYPFRLHLEQHKLTPMIHAMLSRIPHAEVRFSARVAGLEQADDRVTLRVATPDGAEEMAARWVVGADGGHSAVRKCCGIEFEGYTYPERFSLVSTPFDLGAIGYTETAYIAHPDDWCAVFHLPDEGPPGLWRFLYGCRPEETEEEALSDRSVQARLQAFIPRDRPYETCHRTIYRVHQRVAKTFRAGRVLLAGDAAHLNNPLGGFGMNAGLQDAANLTEKLGSVWRGEADESVLDRYGRQRRAANIEYVQEASIRNKRTLEERDPAVRRQRIEEYRKAAQTPALAKQILMKSSMIASMRHANAIQ